MDDLVRLSEVARAVLTGRVSRTLVAGQYVGRLIMLTLCQGAAQHYIDGIKGVRLADRNGVKDLDVWAFFQSGLEKPFPSRAHWKADFGESHLGHHPEDKEFKGRRVDILGRSIVVKHNMDAKDAVKAWLCGGSSSAKHLARRPVIGLFPKEYFGKSVWRGLSTCLEDSPCQSA